MFEAALRKIRQKVQTRQYIVTLHAEEEMEDDEFSIFDVERAILTGRINERQRDKDTGEWKYRIVGSSIDGRKMEVVTKISPTGKLVIITVYAVSEH